MLPQVIQKNHLMDTSRECARLMNLVSANKVPDQILGWLVIVMCLRILRNVFGVTNQHVPEALSKFVEEDDEE